LKLKIIRYVLRRRRRLKRIPTNNIEYKKHKAEALALVMGRIEYFNAHYNFKYKKISIKQQRTRWGSCSRQGNLNFNYKLLFLPEQLRDYVIVHELCHLNQFNHSPAFWQLVAQTFPRAKALRKQLIAWQ
jgi:predicted metal-dependent hydrolase